MKHKHLSLTEKNISFLEKEAKKLGISISEILRRWLDEKENELSYEE